MPEPALTGWHVKDQGYLGYLPGVVWFYENFRSQATAEAITEHLHPFLTDVSDSPESMALREDDPTPYGFEERTFACADKIGIGARFEVTWDGRDLVNVRAAMFFAAPFQFLGRLTAKTYFRRQMLPVLPLLPGIRPARAELARGIISQQPNVYGRKDVVILEADELVVVGRQISGFPGVSTYITDINYL